MAAGMGSRYGGIKQLEAFGPSGETLIEYSLFDALRAGFGRIVFVIRRDIEDAFREKVLSRFPETVEVVLAYQEIDALPDGVRAPAGRTKPWGTGHAVLVAKGVIDGPFAVINADDFYGAHAYKLMAQFLATVDSKDSTTKQYAMVGYLLKNTLSDHGSVSRGLCHTDARGRLETIDEHTKISKKGSLIESELPHGQCLSMKGNEMVSLNFWGFSLPFLDSLEMQFAAFLETHKDEITAEFYLPSAVNTDLQARVASIQILPSDDSWHGVTYPEDKAVVAKAITKMVEAGQYPLNLWA